MSSTACWIESSLGHFSRDFCRSNGVTADSDVMNNLGTETVLQLHLEPFRQVYAPLIAEWPRTRQELFWLAPSTNPPLTAAKIAAWQKRSGRSFVYRQAGDPSPIAYAELNPMRRHASHLWLGHCVVRPNLRGEGIGRRFVWELLSEAFEQLGADRVLLIVFPENAAAVRCYRRCGFRVAGSEFHRFGDNASKCRLLRLEAQPFDTVAAVSREDPRNRSAYSDGKNAP